jgi:hypothetical protein
MAKTQEPFRYDLHKELWEWLSCNPGRYKHEWPRWVHNRGDIDPGKSFCIACYYNMDNKSQDEPALQCTHCPICVGGRDTLKECMGGLFEKWFLANSQEEKAEAARAIRDLPVVKGVSYVG